MFAGKSTDSLFSAETDSGDDAERVFERTYPCLHLHMKRYVGYLPSTSTCRSKPMVAGWPRVSEQANEEIGQEVRQNLLLAEAVFRPDEISLAQWLSFVESTLGD